VALGDLPTGEDKRVRVQDMFDRIAPKYDALNRVISAGMDQRWRRRSLDKIGVRKGDAVVDLACGTGDFCELVEQRGASVIGVDFALQMLKQARIAASSTKPSRGMASGSLSGPPPWTSSPAASRSATSCR